MITTFLKHLIFFCSFCIITGEQSPDTTEKGCSDVLKTYYISGIPDIDNWKYEEIDGGNVVKCNGTMYYSSPQVLKLRCHRKTQNSTSIVLDFTQTQTATMGYSGSVEFSHDNVGDIDLNGVLNPKYDDSTIECKIGFPNNAATYITVRLQYEPNNTLPVERRPNLANAILFKIKTNDSGDFCDTTTDITIKRGPLMLKISGNYDKADHFWCTVNQNDKEEPTMTITKDDFSEFENPKEAIAIVDTVHIYAYQMKWNCTLLTRKGAEIHPNNSYYYENAFYSKIPWIGSVRMW